MKNTLQAFHQQFGATCLKYRVKDLYAFGSETKALDFDAVNDINLIVAFNQDVKIEEYAIEEVFERMETFNSFDEFIRRTTSRRKK